MPKEHRVTKAITITESLWERLGELGEELDYKDRSHSQLISETVSAAITKWRESPYVCHWARHFVLVTGGGHVFYRLLQGLKLNSDRQKLPCNLEMKPEKRQDYLDRKPDDIEEAEWFRSRWIFNHFAVWHTENSEGLARNFPCVESSAMLLDSWVDRKGTNYKMADLEVRQEAGRSLTREIIVGLYDYVQWRDKDGGSGYDRIDIPIDIPSRNLEVVVIIDASLYRKVAATGAKEVQNLGLEFRNREGARFGVKEVYDPENLIESYAGRCLDGKSSPKSQEILPHLKVLEDRMQSLANGSMRGEKILSEECRRRFSETFSRPDQFLFYKLKWPAPSFGIEVCVHWQKAFRGEEIGGR